MITDQYICHIDVFYINIIINDVNKKSIQYLSILLQLCVQLICIYITVTLLCESSLFVQFPKDGKVLGTTWMLAL